ncbi:MAG TPA: single-stranded DNA-binding protein [Candidatus Limnocylindrales bacterium]|nr:single-stranded DNA-binding protein [Candidatus Limnocylindrales bacterium]
MAKSVNKVILLGNLGKDPELKSTPGGIAIATFSLATSSSVKDKDGNWQEKTEWHNVKAFQRTAEIAAQYLKKGNKVYIEGRLHSESWDDKETGQKKYKTEVIVNELVLLGGPREGGEGGGGYSGSKSGGAKASGGFDQRVPEHEEAPAHSGAGEITDEDIPF